MKKINYKNYHRDNTYNNMSQTFKNIFQKRYNLIKEYFKKDKGVVLDIGCSNGIFLDIYKDEGFETWGVEVSENAIKAKNKGHRIIKSEFEKANLPGGYFDLVILNHTLEHLKDPKKILEKVKKILKKDGVVFIDVPNVGSLSSKILGSRWPYLLPEEHLWQFDRKILGKIVGEQGFKIIHWESRSGIFEYANPVKELRRKRFLLDILSFPYAFVATFLKMGDSMSFILKKK